MSKDKLVPQSDNSLAPVKGEALLRFKGRRAVIVSATGAVAAWFSTFQTWGAKIIGWLDRLDFLGTGFIEQLRWVFSPTGAYAMAGLFLVLFFIAIYRTVFSNGRPQPSAEAMENISTADAEKLKDLEQEITSLTHDGGVADRTIQQLKAEVGRARESAETHSMRATIRDKELERLETQYKWLHELADNDRRFIDKFVKVLECKIGRHDLLTELYIEFEFSILNASVYQIVVGEDDRKVKGDTFLNSRELSRDKKITRGSIRRYAHGETGTLRVRHWLTPEEVTDFLKGPNKAGEFRFKGWEIGISGDSPQSEVIPKNLEVYGLSVSGKPLWELYRELQIEIQQATFTAYWNFEHGIEERMTIPAFYGFLINMQVRIVNPRPTQVTIRGCRLTVKVKGKEYAADAETGAVIYQHRIISKGEPILQGEKFENLNPTYLHPRIVEAKDEYTGHLQFIVRDAPQFGDDEEKGPVSATLSISDASGEFHRAEGQLSYVTTNKR
jgi:hypothetical protein